MYDRLILIDTDTSQYFWLLGLFNNLLFILILSSSESLYKNHISIVSLCAILPGFICKISTPFWIKYDFLKYNYRIYLVVVSYLLSYIFVSLLHEKNFMIIGIILSSLASALGETIFIPIAGIISNNSLSYWSSGSGFAGLIGSGYYLLMTKVFKLNYQNTLLCVCWIPFIIFYFFKKIDCCHIDIANLDYTVVSKNDLKKWVMNFIIPLSSVYFFEYFINLSILPNVCVISNNNVKNTYPIYIFFYQLGVLVSRSSKIIFKNLHLSKTYIFSLLQLINLVILLLETQYHFLPNIYILYFIIFYEGILGGICYVLTFNNISKNVSEDKIELCCTYTIIGDIFGQTSASLISIFMENII